MRKTTIAATTAAAGTFILNVALGMSGYQNIWLAWGLGLLGTALLVPAGIDLIKAIRCRVSVPSLVAYRKDAIHDLLNADIGSEGQFMDWHVRYELWCHIVGEALRKCFSKAEQARFEDLGPLGGRPLYPGYNDQHRIERTMLAEHLERLQRIIDDNA